MLYQIVERLQIIHKVGYIHWDIKPENIMLGRYSRYRDVYLIDFSLSEKYVDDDGEVLEEPAHSVFKGSISFCSKKVLDGKYPWRADDIESLLYSMMFMLKGTLPWLPPLGMEFKDSKDKKDFVIELKRSLKSRDVFIGYPSVFLKIFKEIEHLSFTDEPDYESIKSHIMASIDSNFSGINIGEFEPFKWKGAKNDYIKGKLDLKNTKIQYDDSLDSFVKQELFVDSFANFKSFEVNEHQDESIDSPNQVVEFLSKWNSETKKNEQYSSLKELIMQVIAINLFNLGRK